MKEHDVLTYNLLLHSPM